MGAVTLSVNGRDVPAEAGQNLLQACLAAGIYIPHLCHHADLTPLGACRLCVVEIDGVAGLQPSRTTKVAEGMVVRTEGEQIGQTRRLAMELMLAGHPSDCGTCVKYLNCELQSLKQYLVSDHLSVKRRSRLFPVTSTDPLFSRDPNKCVLCGRCVRACHELRGVGVLHYKRRGAELYIGTDEGRSLADSGCRFCGACAEVCPTGAIMDKAEFGQGKNRKEALLPCRSTCPAEIDVPRYVRFIREMDFGEAVAVIREKVPFPGVLGHVCNHPCESACRRGAVNDPISIRDLKRYAVEHDDRRAWRDRLTKKPDTDKRVAIIGSGPAGLTAAYFLATLGHAVTLFEALPLPGGMLRYGIPEYRLPRAVLEAELDDIRELGVEIRTDTRVEFLEKLLDDAFDAVLIACGATVGAKPPIPGAGSEGVRIGVDFLHDIAIGQEVPLGKRVAVLGGGNVAFDCARVARRLGAEHVYVACLESRETMPAACDEIEQGEQEGITVYPSRTFTRILAEGGRVAGVEFLDVCSFAFGEDGKLEIDTVHDSHHVIEADSVLFAIGQRPDIPGTFDVELTSRRFVEVDPYTFATSRDGVFAAGDATAGTTSVIQAIASGRKAAVAVDKFLGGRGKIDQKLASVTTPSPRLEPVEDFAALPRVAEVCLLPEERLLDFRTVAELMDDEAAEGESGRCLQCDLRLQLAPVKFWGSY